MNRSILIRLYFLSFVFVVTLSLASPLASPSEVVKRTVWMALSDGVRLATDVYLPAAGGEFPALLIRTPYGKARARAEGEYFASHGYVVVVQDCRGSGASQGDFYAYIHEGKDGYEAQEWLGRQEWCNGIVGTLGESYLGGTQWLAAPYGSRHLKAMAPVATFSSFYGNLYLGGAFRLDLAAGWTAGRTAPSPEAGKNLDYIRASLHLPLVEMDEVFGWRIDMLRDWVGNDRYGPYWEALNVESAFDRLDLPALHMVGLYDFFLAETVKSYQLMERRAKTENARRNQKLIIGPWEHYPVGERKVAEVDFGPGAVLDKNALYKRWFDHHLKGIDNGIDREPPIRYFVMGLNDWRKSFRWPPQATRWMEYYLRSDGHAGSPEGDGALSTEPAPKAGSDTFLSDPEKPIPARGGRDVEPTYNGDALGPYDQRKIEQNPNVLVFTSPPLERDLEVAGPLQATLYVETDAVDTDVVVKLVDVFPDGFAKNVATGILRGRFRTSISSPELLTPGKIYEWKVDMVHVSNRFLVGHRIRVDVAGSCFPVYDRNPNTGQGPRSKTARMSHQRLHHSPTYPSRITLPVSTLITR